MFVKRRPHLVNHSIWWKRKWMDCNFNLKPSNQFVTVFGIDLIDRNHLKPNRRYHHSTRFIHFDAANSQIHFEYDNAQDDGIYMRDLEMFEEWSHWNVYFESSQMACTFYGTLSKVPFNVPMLEQMNMHIVTRHQARLEAAAIFMGYVRHALKKQIATSDNTRVIVQCIESVLIFDI